MAPTLYVSSSSPCARAVKMAAIAIGMDADMQEIDLYDKREQYSDWYLKINPKHCVPTLVEEDGWILWENRTVMRYLSDKYGRDDSLYPQEPRLRSKVDQYLDYMAAELGPHCGAVFVPMTFRGKQHPDPAALSRLLADLKMVEQLPSMRNGEYLVNNQFTIADISMIVAMDYCYVVNAFPVEDFPNINRWRLRVMEQPCFQQTADEFHSFMAQTKTKEWAELMERKKKGGLN